MDVAVTALTHLEMPLPNGEAALDGRPLAFQPDLESARVPDCSAPIVEVTFSYIVPIAQVHTCLDNCRCLVYLLQTEKINNYG